MKKRILSAFLIISLLLCSSCSMKTIKFDYFDGKFSPFFVLHTGDMSVTAMVHETLLVTNGEDSGEKILDAYTKGVGVADITLDDSDMSKLVCTIKIGEDVTFSDGTPMTADDVIFSMYVYADRDYEGWSGFNSTSIEGLKNYRYNNSFAQNVSLTEEQLDKALENPDEKLSSLIKEKVINPVLEDEMEWAQRVYDDSSYLGTELGQYMGIYPEAKDLFAYLYSIDKNYDSKSVDTADKVVEDIKAQYGIDYETLGKVIGADLKAAARRCAEEVITESILETMESQPVNTISGIQKIDDKTVNITLNTHDDNQLKTMLGIYIAPMHYYGDKALYDYEGAKFGFVRGDLSKLKEKNAAPVGAGRYILKEYKNNKVVFEQNKDYFRNIPLENKVIFEATGNSSESKVHGYYVTYENYTYIKN